MYFSDFFGITVFVDTQGSSQTGRAGFQSRKLDMLVGDNAIPAHLEQRCHSAVVQICFESSFQIDKGLAENGLSLPVLGAFVDPAINMPKIINSLEEIINS